MFSFLFGRWNLRCFSFGEGNKQKELIKIRRLWIVNSANIKHEIDKVQHAAKRKFKKNRETAEEKNKKDRAKKRKLIHLEPFFVNLIGKK